MARYPSLRLLINFIPGILTGHVFPEFKSVYLWAACFLILVSLLLAFFDRPSNRFALVYILMVGFSGAALGGFNHHSLPKNTIVNYVNQELWVLGEVKTRVTQKRSHSQWMIKCNAIFYRGDTLQAEGMVLVDYFHSGEQPLNIKIGHQVWMYGTITLPSKPNLPEAFDYRAYLARKQIFTTLRVHGEESLDPVSHEQENFQSRVIGPIYHVLQQTIDALFSNQDARAFIKAAILGDRGELSAEIKTAFQVTGTYHLLAISGLHVGLFYMLIMAFMQRFRQTKTGKVLTALTVTLILFIFSNLTGNAPPVERATIMAIVFCWSSVLQKKTYAINTLAFADLVILLKTPNDVFNPGFLLSNAAVLAIIIWYPIFIHSRVFQWFMPEKSSKAGYVRPLFWFFYRALALSMAATLGVWPLLAYYFGQPPFLGLLINVPVTLIVATALQATVPALLLYHVFEPLAFLYAVFVSGLLEWSFMMTHAMSQSSMSALPLSLSLTGLFILYGIIITLLSLKKSRVWPKCLIVTLLGINAWIWFVSEQTTRLFVSQLSHNALILGYQNEQACHVYALNKRDIHQQQWLHLASILGVQNVSVQEGFAFSSKTPVWRNQPEALTYYPNQQLTKIIYKTHSVILGRSCDYLFDGSFLETDMLILKLKECSQENINQLKDLVESSCAKMIIVVTSPEMSEEEKRRLNTFVFQTASCRLLNYEKYVQL